MKASPRSARAVTRSRRTRATTAAHPTPQARSRRLRLRRLILACPSCHATHEIDADTPRQVFDPETHRLACPVCLAVVRLLPYPDARSPIAARQSDADVQAMAVDILTHPLCAGLGVYDPVEGPAGRDRRGVIAVYLCLAVPPATY